MDAASAALDGVCPLGQSLRRVPLSEQALANLRDFFDQRGHRPSPAMWTALRAVLKTLEDMANGTCADAIHLSSLDPGVGKTTSVIFFLQALLASPDHKDVGVLVCVQRREQIETIVKQAELDRSDFAVLTAADNLNALGCGEPQRGQVLFTTHSMVERRCDGRAFSDVAALKFRGQIRAVRIWDEAILPGQTLTLARDDLGLLLKPFRSSYPALASDIEDLLFSLKDTPSGSTIHLKDLAAQYRVDLNTALGVAKGNAQQEEAVEALWFLFGKHVTIRQDGRQGNTLLDYKDTLPEDIKPLLALDASARVRTTYQCWEEGRGGLVFLPSAVKRYDNLTIGVWDRGGGKGSFRSKGGQLIEGVAATINTRPDEKWLVVHHKSAGDLDVEEEVRKLILVGTEVEFIHWGAHDATNEYADIPNIILAGTLFYPHSRYEALGRLSSGFPSSRGKYPEDNIKAVTLGEHRHLILQALCRGAVRRCEGDGCPETRAFIIAAKRSGIKDELTTIFPGARVEPWAPVQKALSGKKHEVLEYLKTRLRDDPEAVVTFREAAEAIGWKHLKDFKRCIRKHPDFIAALDGAGLEEWGAGEYPRGFRAAGWSDE